MKISIAERNRQILQMLQEGVRPVDVAGKFNLSPSRIHLIEKGDRADRSMEERGNELREQIRAADDPEKMWPVNDMVDAIGVVVATKKRLLDHFVAGGKQQISLRELMDMFLPAPVNGSDFMATPLLGVRGVGKFGFWSVANGLTGMDLGKRCNEEWQKTLVKVGPQRFVRS